MSNERITTTSDNVIRESNPRYRVDQTLFTFDRADRYVVASRFSPPRTSSARKCTYSHLPCRAVLLSASNEEYE